LVASFINRGDNATGCTYALKIKGLSGNKYKLNGEVITASADEIQLKGSLNKIEVLRYL